MEKTKTITLSGASATATRRTPRTQLWGITIGRRAVAAQEAVAEAWGIDVDNIDSGFGIMRLVVLSTRLVDLEGVDFETLTLTDDAKAIEAKWLAFLESGRLDFIQACEQAIDDLDAASDPALAPTPPADMGDDEKKGASKRKKAS